MKVVRTEVRLELEELSEKGVEHDPHYILSKD